MKRRKVRVYEWRRVPGKNYNEKVSIGDGLFIQYGVNFEEFESGPGNFSTAIVEMVDGSVENVPVEMIVFDKGET